MNILRITIPDTGTFYYSKKGVSKNCLRLTEDIEAAQTYNNPNSAKAGITNFKEDLRMAVQLHRWGHKNLLENQVVELAKKGHNFKIENLEATITIK